MITRCIDWCGPINMSILKPAKMNLSRVIFLMTAALMFLGCSEDTDPWPKQPVPEWQVDSPALFPNSFSAFIAIPENLQVFATDKDMVAAFINNQCRGVGTLIRGNDDKISIYALTIRAKEDESGSIVFRYYNSRLSYLYEARQRIAFEIDGTYGTFDAPEILDLEPLAN